MDPKSQYLSKESLIANLPKIDVKPGDLGSTDTYHEEKILMKFRSIDGEGQSLIYKAAIQLAIIGFGNKNYGFIRINEKEVVNLTSLFNKYGIKFMEKINSKFNDDELSARRLLRLFRYQIQQFIINYNRPSYLWLKYANKENKDYMSICFPGGEHLITTREEAEFLLDTYSHLDTILNTKFRNRLKRVFIARNIIAPEYFIDKNY